MSGFGAGGFDYGQPVGGGYGGADPMGGGFGGGGGFMSQADPSTSGGAPSSAGKGGKANRDRQTLVPMTIRQLKGAKQEHTDDPFKVDGVEIHQVKLVGNVLQVAEQSTFIVYQIEDGTGSVEVKLWLDSDESEFHGERRRSCHEGAYVRVVGNVRTYEDTLHVVAFDIRPVEDMNELTNHMLETIYVHLVNTKSLKPPSSTASSGMPAFGGSNPFGGPSGPGGFGPQNLSSAMAMEAHPANGAFDPVQSQVLQFFQQNDTGEDNDAGVNIQMVIESLASRGLNEGDVRNAVEFLSGEGHLYSTIDEAHFKATS